MKRTRARAVPGDGLLHPMVAAAVALLLINDHVLKALFRGPVTGKLSDVAGLVFFPFGIVAVWEVFTAVSRVWRGPRVLPLIIATIATASVFVAIKISSEGSSLFADVLGRTQWVGATFTAWVVGSPTPHLSPVVVVRDPTDLVALVALLATLVVGVRRINKQVMPAEVDRSFDGHRDKRVALLALMVAGLASLATTEGPPGVRQESKDHLSFSGDQRTEVRHVRVEVVSGKGDATVSADVPIETGGVNGKRPVALTVIRDRDGKSVLDDFGPSYQAGLLGSIAGNFDAIDSCASGQTCTETFTFTFTRIPEDNRQSLDFDWSIRAGSAYSIETSMSPPPGASLTVTITR